MSKPATDPIRTTAAQLPRHCPACYRGVPIRTSESSGVTRLTCAVCSWTERYRVVERV